MELRFLGPLSAGFPSPASDWQARRLDIRDLLTPHPTTTYFARVSGESMSGACIGDRDIVVIDRAITATPNAIVVARLADGFVIKRLRRSRGRTLLSAEHGDYPAIDVTGRTDFEIWGVVTLRSHSSPFQLPTRGLMPSARCAARLRAAAEPTPRSTGGQPG